MRNLEGEGDKGKEDFLHKSHVIMQYILHKDKFDPKTKVERWIWLLDQSRGAKMPIFL